MGILDIGSFETNSKAINNAYETYVLGVGDFDERIFLEEDANAEIGTPAKSSTSDQGTLTERITVKKDLRHSFEVCVCSYVDFHSTEFQKVALSRVITPMFREILN